MTGKVKPLADPEAALRIRGVGLRYWSPKFQRYVTRSWPKGHGADSLMRQIAREDFKAAVALIKNASAEDRFAAEVITRNTPLLGRDVLMKAAYGKLFKARTKDGVQWKGTRTVQWTTSMLLDLITTTPGMMLIRDTNEWIAISRDDLGDVQAILNQLSPGTNEVPIFNGAAWVTVDASSFGDVQAILDQLAPAANDLVIYDGADWTVIAKSALVSIQSLLDSIGSTRGDLLFRGASAWSPFAPGSAHDILTSGGSGADPAWATIDQLLDILGSAAQGQLLFRGASLWQFLNAGNNGDVLTSGGAGANPAWASLSSVAGANVLTFAPPPSSSLTAGASTVGNLFNPKSAISITAIAALITTVTSGTYKLGIAPYNTSTNKVTAAPTYTGTFTCVTGAANDVISGKLASPFVCAAGTDYIIFLVRSDATSSTNMTRNTSLQSTFGYGVYIAAANTTQRIISNQAPGTGDVWSTVANSSMCCISFGYAP